VKDASALWEKRQKQEEMIKGCWVTPGVWVCSSKKERTKEREEVLNGRFSPSGMGGLR